MSRAEVRTSPTRVKAAHRYEVVNAVNRLKIAGARFHFIGAGGVGMSGLAKFLIEKHAIVTGSDQSANAAVSRLVGSGADIRIGHSAGNIGPDTEAVVVSAAVQDDNPELQQAIRQGCPVFKYAQLLGLLMDHFQGIAVSGTHGKSTTSGWLAYGLRQVGVDANFVVGADVCQLGASSGSGDSGFFVAEACEYDRSFLNLRPQIACILNIEADHLDCYRDEGDIVDAFYRFARGTKPDGLIVANGQDANVAKVIERLDGRRRVVTFGFGTKCSVYPRNVRVHRGSYRFDVYQDGRRLGSTSLSVPGRHNILNALAVTAVAVNIGVEPEAILGVLDRFTGVDRRLMLKGCCNGVTVLDDYAHHPTEIRASLKAIREKYHPKRLWCVYQAHQYSRTRFFLDAFAASFREADKAIIPEIYFVRDSDVSRSEVNADILAGRIRAEGTDAEYVGTFDAVCDCLEKELGAGDLVVTMGAGDVWKVADEYLRRLGGNR
ncbi:UDP-N-acetylmuramate--L-alanine ligase [Anaerobaca lacustris]|uniref:UDP-N-acetylmuramate--L-alanine ligase n=1 Tax=Anaerobaca lacustris TaxID=3044600 RepID=A0AAW6TXV3_9BACT|nr:UDP-N-acetylmuramate--L-alanine ligase [Sedimentisphaerales bacterium M17dextr]